MELKTDTYTPSDGELVYLIEENNGDAKDYLYKKYSGMIHKELNKVKKSAYALKIDWSDLVQEALLGFANAINTFNDTNDTQFSTYATLCVKRKLLNYIEKASTKKSYTMQKTISIDSDDLKFDINNYLKEKAGQEPLNNIVTRESIKEINAKFDKLSDMEKRAIDLSISGAKPTHIAEILGVSVKKVYNILYRARNKLR